MKKPTCIAVQLILVLLCHGLLHAGLRVTSLPDLAKPTRIEVRGDNLYVADGARVFLYNLRNPSQCKSFGREGEGPGEFKALIYFMETTPDGLVINSEGRISWFDAGGSFIRQQTESALGLNFKTFGNGFVGMKLGRDEKKIVFTISIFDPHLKKVRELHRYRHPFFGRDRLIDAVDARISSYHAHGDRVYIDVEGGGISVFDETGKKVHVFTPIIESIRVEKGHREHYLQFWKSDLKAEYQAFKDRLVFPDHFPPIRDFLMDDGRIYIITHKEKGEENEVIILNTDGRELRRGWIPLRDVNPVLPHLFSPYTIRGGVLYKLVDNEVSESWELHTIPINSH